MPANSRWDLIRRLRVNNKIIYNMQVRGFFLFTNFTHVNVENNVYVEVVNRYILKPLLKDSGNPKANRIILKLILKK